MNPKIRILLSIILLLPAFLCARGPEDKPNVIIILTDDQGWNDVGFNGGKDIHTPNLDQLAAGGVVFPQGYVSHPYCSPSRAGLLTGRYQQKYGHECNPGYEDYETEEPPGLPLSETLLPELLEGYATGAIGKWHLGDDPKFLPTERGFDHWYGFSGGGRSFWSHPGISGKGKIIRGGEVQPEHEVSYLTNDFTENALGFIEKHKKDPFFLYLAYNAPHAPMQAPFEYLERTSYLENGARGVYAAMVVAVDDGVGKIMQTLEEAGIREKTLVIFLSDNGGADNLGASNRPLRGRKGMLFEGGIRVPFCMAWPDGINAGLTYPNPVSALDIFPTVLAATGNHVQESLSPDGVNLLPFLEYPDVEVHPVLYWRYSGGQGWAVRRGRYKLVSQHMKALSLFDMEKDPLEHLNLAEELPGVVEELRVLYEDWNKGNTVPLWDDPHIENVEKQEMDRLQYLEKAGKGEKK